MKSISRKIVTCEIDFTNTEVDSLTVTTRTGLGADAHQHPTPPSRRIMRTRKLGLGLLVAALSTGLLAGVTSPVAAAPTTTIKITTFGNVIQQWAIDEYKKLHPEIKLDIIKVGMDESKSKLQNCLTSKTCGDIYAQEVAYAGYWKSYKSSYFEDLSNIGLRESDFLDWRWAHGTAKDGTQIGIPTDVGGLQVAYRWDLFKAHGLPYTRDAVSALWPTWDDFIETGKRYTSKLTAAEKSSCTKKKICYNFIDNAGTIYAAVLNQGTKKYYETNGTLIYKTNPQVKEAFTTTAKALSSGINARYNQFSSDWNIGMKKGTFAVVLAPAWMLDYIKQQAPRDKKKNILAAEMKKWDIADLPGGGGNLGGSQLMVPAAAKKKTEAKAFIAWYLSPSIQLEIFNRYGLFPSTKSLYNNSALTGKRDAFFNNAPVGSIYTNSVKQLRPIYEGKNQRAIDSYFGQALSKVALGKMNASQAWDDAIKNITKNVKN